MAENETKETLSKVMVESQVLKNIRAEHLQLQQDLSECGARMEQNKTIQKDILLQREVAKNMSSKLHILQQLLHAVMCEKTSFKEGFEEIKVEYNRISGLLLQALLQSKVVSYHRRHLFVSNNATFYKIFPTPYLRLCNKLRKSVTGLKKATNAIQIGT